VTVGYRTRRYSRNTRNTRSFAPAMIQVDTSLLIFANSVVVDHSHLSKFCVLSSFQISKITAKVRLLKARRGESGNVVIIVHHCKASWVGVQLDGDKPNCVVQAAISSQIRFTYLQFASRWWVVSIHCRQRMQELLCGHPGSPS
jgi:hypothetical protein